MEKRYEEIRKEYNGEYIPYDILLSSVEWKMFRNRIVKEQNHKCQKCGNKPTENAWEMNGKGLPSQLYVRQDENGNAEYTFDKVRLNVHHKYYIKNNLPWEYSDEAMLTVCADCHILIHKTEEIKVYSDSSLIHQEDIQECKICFGTGYRDKYHYYLNGICFHCAGKGFSFL